MGAMNVIREIRRATRRRFSAEDKIRIVLEGLRGEISVTDLCRRGGSRRRFTIVGPNAFWRRARTG